MLPRHSAIALEQSDVIEFECRHSHLNVMMFPNIKTLHLFRVFQSTNICVDVYSPLYIKINSVRTKIFFLDFYISILSIILLAFDYYSSYFKSTNSSMCSMYSNYLRLQYNETVCHLGITSDIHHFLEFSSSFRFYQSLDHNGRILLPIHIFG